MRLEPDPSIDNAPEDAGPDEAPKEGAYLPVLFEEQGTGVRALMRRKRQRRRRIRAAAFVLAVVLLIAAIPTLSYIGVSTVVNRRRSGAPVEAGQVVRDPTLEEGGRIQRTPAALFIQLGSDRRLVAVTVLGLSADEQGGSVLFLPMRTQAAGEGGTPAALADVYAQSGRAGLKAAAQDLLGVSFELVSEVDDAFLALLSSPAGPFLVENPDAVSGFKDGAVQVEPDEVGKFLSARDPEEDDLVRLRRHRAFWDSWLSAIGGNSAGVPKPREPDKVDMSHFLRGLGAGPVLFTTLPVDAAPAPAVGDYRTDPLSVRMVVARLFPGALRKPAGDRPRVRLLDGADDSERLLAAARRLEPVGMQVVLVRDSDRIVDDTEVVYYRTEDKKAATAMRSGLGTGEIVRGAENPAGFDVTIVVGNDFSVGDGTTTTSTGSATTG
jgi:hypothetical protein